MSNYPCVDCTEKPNKNDPQGVFHDTNANIFYFSQGVNQDVRFMAQIGHATGRVKADAPEPVKENVDPHSEQFIRDNMQDGESFEDARNRLFARFEALMSIVRSGDGASDEEIKEYEELSSRLLRG